jgi:hypothetical protein
VVTDIGITTPKCYFAGKQARNPLLILEDLTGPNTTFGAAQEPLSFARAASILESLAILHARYWEHPDLADDGAFGWVLRSVTGWHLDYMKTMLRQNNWDFYRALPRGAALPVGMSADRVRVEAALYEQFAHHADSPLTLGHGDAHIANMDFFGDHGGLLDWEMRRCPWYHDVTYCLVSSLDVVDRRRWERALLQHYLDKLVSLGIAVPTQDEAFEEYRREIIDGYVLFIINGDGTQYWTEAANCAVTVRFAMAAEDHGTLTAIESGS